MCTGELFVDLVKWLGVALGRLVSHPGEVFPRTLLSVAFCCRNQELLAISLFRIALCV